MLSLAQALSEVQAVQGYAERRALGVFGRMRFYALPTRRRTETVVLPNRCKNTNIQRCAKSFHTFLSSRFYSFRAGKDVRVSMAAFGSWQKAPAGFLAMLPYVVFGPRGHKGHVVMTPSHAASVLPRQQMNGNPLISRRHPWKKKLLHSLIPPFYKPQKSSDWQL